MNNNKNLVNLSELSSEMNTYNYAYSIILNHDRTIISHKDFNNIGKRSDDFPWINKILKTSTNVKLSSGEGSAASEEQASRLQEVAKEAECLKNDAIKLEELIEKFKV